MSNESITTHANDSCGRADVLRDYAFDELNAADRKVFEQHLGECGECAAELDRLQLTTAALRMLPDQEIPQRIAFVSDAVVEPSQWSWLSGFWNSGTRLGFASACVLALAILVFSFHRPEAAMTAGQVMPASTATSQQMQEAVNRAVNEAVNQAVSKVRADDAQILQAALDTADRKHDKEHQALMVAMEESMTVLQKRLSTYTVLASADAARMGGGQ